MSRMVVGEYSLTCVAIAARRSALVEDVLLDEPSTVTVAVDLMRPDAGC